MTEKVCWLRDQQCASHLQSELNEQRKLGIDCNFTLSNGATERQVHRCVIRTFSLTIHAQCGSEKALGDLFTLKEISADTLDAIVDYVYTSDLKITQQNVWELLSSGRQLSNDFIQQSCLAYLCDTITPENCMDIILQSMSDDLKAVHDKCIQVGINSFDVLSQHAEFVRMAFEDLFTIVSHSGLVVESEEALLASIHKWIQHDCENRRIYAKRLGGTIRFQLFDAHSLLNLLHCEGHKPYHELIEEAFVNFANISKEAVLKQWSRKTPTNTELCEKQTLGDSSKAYWEGNIVKDVLIFGGRSKSKGRLRDILWYKVELTSATTNCEVNEESEPSFPVTINNISNGQTKPIIQLPQSRKGFGAEHMKGQVFLIGGHPDKVRDTVDVLDLRTGVWFIGPDLNEGRSWHATTTNENCIYVVGGSTSSGKPLKSCEFLDIRTSTWQALPPMTSARLSLGLCRLDTCLFAVGGVNNATVEAFDQHAWAWRTLNQLSDVREAPAVAQYGGSAFIISGADTKGCSSKVEKYSFERHEWSKMADISFPRAFAAVANVEEYALLFGGRNDQEASAEIQLYNMKTDCWSLSSVRLPEPRSSSQAVVVDISK